MVVRFSVKFECINLTCTHLSTVKRAQCKHKVIVECEVSVGVTDPVVRGHQVATDRAWTAATARGTA